MTTFNSSHNHKPHSEVTHAYLNRLRDLTDEHREYLCSIAGTGVPAEDALTCFRRRYPLGPPITARDVENIKQQEGTPAGGSQDADKVLQRLLDLKAQDDRWFVRWVLFCSGWGKAGERQNGLQCVLLGRDGRETEWVAVCAAVLG